MTVSLYAGWTEPIRYRLVEDGVPFDLTNYSVSIEIRLNGQPLPIDGALAKIDDGVDGLVEFTPGRGDLKYSALLHDVRFRVVHETSGAVSFFPRGTGPEQWRVER